MSMFAFEELSEFSDVAHWLALKGWSEGQGGNMSVRLEQVSTDIEILPDGPAKPMPVVLPQLAGTHLLVTGSGTRARQIAQNPAQNVGLYRISKDGQSYCWLRGNDNHTSEFPSHCLIQAELITSKSACRAIVHTHPPKLIALTHMPEFLKGVDLSDRILRMQSEARLQLPNGAAHLPHEIPGSLDLGLASAEAIKKHMIMLWHMHGALAVGNTLSDALDKLEIFEKAADIYWILRSAGVEAEGINDDDLLSTLEFFGRREIYNKAFVEN